MKVSVIICTRNRLKLLMERSLPSALSQTYKDFEHIVIDGGSKDGTAELLQEYLKLGQIDTLISEPDNNVRAKTPDDPEGFFNRLQHAKKRNKKSTQGCERYAP